MDCKFIYERIENIIYKNKFVIIYNKNDKTYVDKNLKEISNYKFVEIEVEENEKNLYEKCLDKKYGNDNNNRMIFKNTNEYDSNNSIYRIIFPMIFINAMNIGGFKHFNEMIYRREIDKF